MRSLDGTWISSLASQTERDGQGANKVPIWLSLGKGSSQLESSRNSDGLQPTCDGLQPNSIRNLIAKHVRRPKDTLSTQRSKKSLKGFMTSYDIES